MKTIDLGKKPESHPEPPMSAKESDKESQVYYPSLYLSFDSDDMKDFPESGKAMIEFKVVSRTVSEREGKKSCSMDLEIRSITPKGKSEKNSMDEIEEGLQQEENSNDYEED